jgi:hypothetical protein
MLTPCRYASVRLAPLLGVLLAFVACKSVPTTPNDLLDPNTGNTVTVVEEPLLFARVRGDSQALVHDFVRLVAAETDSAGKYRDFMLLYRWTLTDGGESPPKSNAGRLLVMADGRLLELLPLEQIPAELSRRDGLFAPSSRMYTRYAYRIDEEQLRQIAESQSLTAQLPEESPDTAYALWRDGRPALSQFIKQSMTH